MLPGFFASKPPSGAFCKAKEAFLCPKFCYLQIISSNLYEGDHIDIVGGNGVGKTTLLNILSGKLTPDEGSVIRVILDRLRTQIMEVKDGQLHLYAGNFTACRQRRERKPGKQADPVLLELCQAEVISRLSSQNCENKEEREKKLHG